MIYNTARKTADTLWGILMGAVTFFVLFFVSNFGVTSLVCLGSEPADACGDFGLVIAPFSLIFSIFATNFLMKRRSAYLQSKGLKS